jgi:hypothetical protein
MLGTERMGVARTRKRARKERKSTVAISARDRLAAGEIDVEGYLDLKVIEATAHLEGLGRAHHDVVRGALRAQLETEPELMALVGRATGRTRGG